jgi:hypothetical protein
MSHTPKLPKELHPGFSTKAIPTCRVILDKNNPLTRGIKFACLFAQGFNNLATGKGPITNQLTFEGGRARQTSTNIIQYDRDDSGFDSELGTFALDMKGYSGNDFYARILEISGTEYQLLRQTDSEVGFNIGGSVVYFSGFDTIFGAGADTNIVARWDEANSSRKVTVNDKTVSDGTSFTVTNTSTDVYIFNRADGGRPSDASLSYFVIWDRFLTQRETDEFNAAPYQIFKPAIDITYFYQAAAAATTKLLKLPKEWHPGFSTKVKGGINPASPLAVDWSHPLSKGLARFMYITSGGLYDAVSGKLYKQDTDEAKVARINGLALDASSSYYFSLEETTYSASSSQTFTWLAAKDTADSVDGMIAGDSTDTGYFIWMNNTSANVLCRRFGTDTTLTISSIDNSDMTPRTWVHDVDGNEERLQADGSVATGTFNNNAFIENAVVRGYTGGSFNLDGKFHYYIVHEKALNRGEVEELQRNPFLLLKPAIDITYFTSTAGGGAFTLTADSGTYTYTGTAAATEAGRKITANSGSYAYSGTAAGLNYGFVLTADSGSYTYTGTNAAVEAAFNLAANSGSYTYSGTAADLNLGRTLSGDSGSYTYSGTAVALTFASAGSFTLTADSGSYTYSGTAASVAAGVVMAASSGSYTYSGTSATLTRNYPLAANSGSYTYTGTANAFVKDSAIAANSGTYGYTGTAAILRYSAVVSVNYTIGLESPMIATLGAASTITTTRGVISTVDTTRGVKGLIQ